MTLLQRGVLQVSPPVVRDSCKHIVLSSAVHGNETAPIELLDELVRLISEQKLTPEHPLLFVIAHPQSILEETRFIETNLNRLFGHQHYPDSLELTIACNLKEQIKQFWQDTAIQSRWHLDMHCSIRASKHYTFAISPQSSYPTRDKEFVSFMLQGGIEALLLSEEASSTFSWFSASEWGAQAATFELGQVAQLGCNDPQKLTSFSQALMELIQLNPDQQHEETQDSSMIFYQVHESIYRENEQFELCFDDALANFSHFGLGEPLAKDGQRVLTMPIEQGRVVFPNANVERSQRAALIVKPCATHYVDKQLKVCD